MKLINDERRPPRSLEKTISIVQESLENRNVIWDYSAMLDILYHLQNFEMLLNFMKRDSNETDQPD